MRKGVSKKSIATFASIEVLIAIVGKLLGMGTDSLICLMIFVVAIIMLVSEVVSRATAALLAAIMTMSALNIMRGIPPEAMVHHYVELGTILTLLGVMIVAQLASISGLFYYIGMKIAKLSRGNPVILYFILAAFTYILNIFLIAIATIMVVVFLTHSICAILKIDSRPYVLMEMFIVNVAASSTMISAVPNIIIAEEAGLSYSFFVIYLLPFTFIFFIVSLWILYSSAPPPTVIDRTHALIILEFDEWLFVKDKSLFYVSLFCFSGMIISFILCKELMLVSIFFGVVALIFYPRSKREGKELDPLRVAVDWDTLIFLMGFYIIIGGLLITGVLDAIAHGLVSIAGDNIFVLVSLLFWVSVILSGFVDNIPYVLIIMEILDILLSREPYSEYSMIFWILLILACNIGGALNPYSAPQNLIAISMSRKSREPIIISEYYRVSIKWTIIGGCMGFIYVLMLMYSSVVIGRIGLWASIAILLTTISLLSGICLHKTIGLRRIKRLITSIPKYIKMLARIVSRKIRMYI